jgi:NADH-quinone oxidoreductase subunit J
MLSQWLFYGFATLSVLGALGLILSRNPMNGAMCFLITLVSLAGLYALLSASLLFVLQLIVYAGAIMSLVVFIIMFLNLQRSDIPIETGKWGYLLGGSLAVIPIGLLLLKIVRTLPGGEVDIVGNGFGQVKEVGLVLFRDWLLPFEVVSILLLVALVGAVVLAGKKEKIQ